MVAYFLYLSIFLSSSKSSDEMPWNIYKKLDFSPNLVFSKDNISSMRVRVPSSTHFSSNSYFGQTTYMVNFLFPMTSNTITANNWYIIYISNFLQFCKLCNTLVLGCIFVTFNDNLRFFMIYLL